MRTDKILRGPIIVGSFIWGGPKEAIFFENPSENIFGKGVPKLKGPILKGVRQEQTKKTVRAELFINTRLGED